jgi:hypothetical protein
MKIRSGFVSNSSSSSFLVIGKEMDIKNITISMVKNKRIIAMGPEFIEGDDVFQINTIEELAFLKALNNLGDDRFSIMDACVFSSEEVEGEIDVKNLPDSGKVKYITGWRDYSSSKDINILKDRYDTNGKVSIIMQRYLRAKKINKLEGK